MNLDHMLAQLRGTLPADVPHPDSFSQARPNCVQRGCSKPVAIKKNGEYARSCSGCLRRRARSCRRRRKALADYVSYYTSIVRFVTRFDVGGRRLA